MASHNQDPNSRAVLIVQNQVPGVLRFTSSPKGVNLMVYEFYRAGIYYSVQLGLNDANSSHNSFVLQQEFLADIQTLTTQ